METKAELLQLKADDDGTVSGYASRFGEVDNGGDTVMPGAFTTSIASGRKVKMLWCHDTRSPIGVWDEMKEDATGLWVKGRILRDVAKGAETLSLLRAGAIDGLSIGYRTKESDRGTRGERRLKAVDLFEISLVTFPMLESARVDAVKAAEMTRRDMEQRLMQDAGFSRSVARALMGGGIEAVKAMQDAGEDEAAINDFADWIRNRNVN
jgi:HK97 family phage prohead protease